MHRQVSTVFTNPIKPLYNSREPWNFLSMSDQTRNNQLTAHVPRQGYEVLRLYASSMYNDPIVHETEIIQTLVQYFSDDFLCGHFSLSLWLGVVISSDIWVQLLATGCPGPNPLIHKFRITTLLSRDKNQSITWLKPASAQEIFKGRISVICWILIMKVTI